MEKVTANSCSLWLLCECQLMMSQPSKTTKKWTRKLLTSQFGSLHKFRNFISEHIMLLSSHIVNDKIVNFSGNLYKKHGKNLLDLARHSGKNLSVLTRRMAALPWSYMIMMALIKSHPDLDKHIFASWQAYHDLFHWLARWQWCSPVAVAQ